MAWPTEAGALLQQGRSRRRGRNRRGPRSRVFPPIVPPPGGGGGGVAGGGVTMLPPVVAAKLKRRRFFGRSLLIDPSAFRHKFYFDAHGHYRIFNAAVYRFYRSNTAPPLESDTPFATNATLPHEPSDTYADGIWFLSVSLFNGVIDSGFLPLGPNGETFLRLDLSGGALDNAPPNVPTQWALEVRAAGVIRVVGFYVQTGALKADEWAITFTTDGSTPGTPPAVSPDIVVAVNVGPFSVIAHDLPAQSDGVTVKVRLQMRRLDSSQVYSENSVVNTATADAVGPTVPLGMAAHPGTIPGVES